MVATTTILFGGGVNRPVYSNLAKAVGVNPGTITKWRGNPDSIKLGDLRTLCRVRGLTDEEILRVVKGK